jgi:DNA-binding MarR family transcriptional regulator
MNNPITPELTRDFLSSARVFAKAVRDVCEAAVLQEVVGDKLSVSQLKLLYLVAQADSVAIVDAATFLGVSSPAASKTVESLVRRRLLRRNEVRGDRRRGRLSLTEASRRLLEAYETARNQKAAEVFGQFSSTELLHTARLLDRLAAGIASQGKNRDAICLQCEIYYREDCRFGARDCRCFYRLHKSNQKDLTDIPASDPDQL